jgi:hypothetical protein
VSDVSTTPRRTVSGRRGKRRGQAAAAGELVARAVAVLIRVTVSMARSVTRGAAGRTPIKLPVALGTCDQAFGRPEARDRRYE